MSFFYQDTDGGSDANDGTTWALAKLTLEGLLAVMSAGDTGFIQGAATDTAASSRTFTSPGTIGNPCKLIGVVDGTTNTGTSVVVADLAVTLPVVSNSGAASDLTFVGSSDYCNIKFISADFINTPQLNFITITNGHMAWADRIAGGADGKLRLINSVLEPTTTAAALTPAASSEISIDGGSFLFTAAAPVVRSSADGFVNIKGCDLGGLTSSIVGGNGDNARVKLNNCKMPASFSIYATAHDTLAGFAELVGCSNASSVAATDSIQDYQYEDAYGTIDLETTAVRTGGADDDATGAFSYAMTPAANATLESSGATLKSPWMSVWVDGGSNTLTVYIANDSASTDYLLDEAWVEFYTPDEGDTAQYDQTFDAGDARLLDSTTAITDDTGSTWGTGANNHQQFSATVTTGYTGWAYARLHLAKRSATPDTLFLDPRIIVS